MKQGSKRTLKLPMHRNRAEILYQEDTKGSKPATSLHKSVLISNEHKDYQFTKQYCPIDEERWELADKNNKLELAS